MNFWRRRRDGSVTLMREAFILLAPIAATCAMILLLFLR
jgi:hypothetical protein